MGCALHQLHLQYYIYVCVCAAICSSPAPLYVGAYCNGTPHMLAQCESCNEARLQYILLTSHTFIHTAPKELREGVSCVLLNMTLGDMDVIIWSMYAKVHVK